MARSLRQTHPLIWVFVAVGAASIEKELKGSGIETFPRDPEARGWRPFR